MASHYQSIAAVIAFSADDGDAMARKRGESGGEKVDYAGAGVLHEDQPGDSTFDREAIHLTHFSRSENFHTPVLGGPGATALRPARDQHGHTIMPFRRPG